MKFDCAIKLLCMYVESVWNKLILSPLNVVLLLIKQVTLNHKALFRLIELFNSSSYYYSKLKVICVKQAEIILSIFYYFSLFEFKHLF